MTHTRSKTLGALLALPVAALLLAGCSAPGTSPEPGGPEQEDFHSWSVKYASCMQDEGLDYPDPSADPNAAMEVLDIDALGGMDAFSAADEVCRGKIGDPPAPLGEDGKPITDEEMRQDALKLTKCLRDQGVEMEDPSPDGGIAIDDSMSPEALEACGISGLFSEAG